MIIALDDWFVSCLLSVQYVCVDLSWPDICDCTCDDFVKAGLLHGIIGFMVEKCGNAMIVMTLFPYN